MDRRSADASKEGESLEDRVYRVRLAGNTRRASPWVTVPLVLAGYFALGLLGWQIVRFSKPAPVQAPIYIDVDLVDTGERDASRPPAPPPLPPPVLDPPAAPAGAASGPGRGSGGPPPGALLRPDALPPKLPANPDTVPNQPPTALPAQDLSGTAFPSRPTGAPGSAGTGSGPGGGGTGEGSGASGSGTGSGPKVVERDFRQIRWRSLPPKPPYPFQAKSLRIQGEVKVEMLVGMDGVPVSAQAIDGPPLLRATAEAYALRMRFWPETENGVPVSAHFLLKMPFVIP